MPKQGVRKVDALAPPFKKVSVTTAFLQTKLPDMDAGRWTDLKWE